MKTKERFRMLLTVLLAAMGLMACIDDNDEAQDKVETVTLYVSDETGTYYPWGAEGAVEGMLIKEKQEQEWQAIPFGGVQGFEYERGYEYELLVEKTTLANPPADAYNIVYRLLEVVSKEAGSSLYRIKVSYYVDADDAETVSADVESSPFLPWRCSYLLHDGMTRFELLGADGGLLGKGTVQRMRKEYSDYPDVYRSCLPDEQVMGTTGMSFDFIFDSAASESSYYSYDAFFSHIGTTVNRLWLYRDWTEYYQEKFPDAGVRAVVCVQKLYWKGIDYEE